MEQLIQLHSVLKPHLQPNFKNFLSFFFFFAVGSSRTVFFMGNFRLRLAYIKDTFNESWHVCTAAMTSLRPKFGSD